MGTTARPEKTCSYPEKKRERPFRAIKCNFFSKFLCVMFLFEPCFPTPTLEPLFELNVTQGSMSGKPYFIGTIQINKTNYTEPVDVVYNFCKAHDLPLSKRRDLLAIICQSLPCHRRHPVVYTKEVFVGGPSKREFVGSIRIIEGQEPADVIDNFYKAHARTLLYDDGQRLRDISEACKSITCSRLAPVIYSRMIMKEGNIVGELVILETDEPLDVINSFCSKYDIDLHTRHSMLNHACTQLFCETRDVIFPKPMYTAEDIHLAITTPQNNSLILGPTVVFSYELEVYVDEVMHRYVSSNHKVFACFHARNTMGEIVSRNYEPGVACSQELVGKLYGLEAGEYILEGWLTDGPDPLRPLTARSSVVFRSIDIPSPTKRQKHRFYRQGRMRKISLAKLRSRATATTVHQVLASMLKAEWPFVAGKVGLHDAHSSSLVELILNPNIDNENENVIRAALHSFHMPLLAMIPADTTWHVLRMSYVELKSIQSLYSRNWVRDGSVDACTSIEANWHAIYEDYCETYKPATTTAAEHKPSSVILSFIRDEEAINAMSRSAVVAGTSWDAAMEDLTVLDGNHRLIAFYGQGYMREKNISCGADIGVPGPSAFEDIQIFVGLSTGFDIPENHPRKPMSLFCSLQKQGSLQQRAPLDVSEMTRAAIHLKIEKDQNGHNHK